MAVHQRTPAEIAQDIQPQSPLDIALDLQQKNQSNSFTHQLKLTNQIKTLFRNRYHQAVDDI